MKLVVGFTASLILSAAANNSVVTEADLLMANQFRGAVQRNLSTKGSPLKVAGKTYSSGLGTAAVAEIPVTVPAHATQLSGKVGIDDGASKKAQVEFRILSGNKILWSSKKIKWGDAAQSFSIDLPPACHKLYLQTVVPNPKGYDLADWLDLAWKNGKPTKALPAKTFSGKEFGLRPRSRDDQSPALQRALQALQAAPGSTLVLEKGTYHFWEAGALPRHFHISNHDQPLWHPISIPLVDLRNVTIDGAGSLFLFHGSPLPILIQDSENVQLKNVALDYEIPHHAQGRLTKVTDEFYEVEIDPKKYPHEIKKNWFIFTGEGWSARAGGGGIVFDGKTHQIVAGTSDYGFKGKGADAFEVIKPGKYRIKKNLKRSGIKVGDILTFRHGSRPHPAITLYRAKNTRLTDVVIHQAHGMGILAQRSENITIQGGGIYPRKGTGRYFSTGADATHFSNCKGKIISENGLYSGMMDDAINVHATCLRIEEKIDERTLRLRYVHGQSVGFEVTLPGESLRFIHAKKLTLGESRTVKSMKRLSTKEILVSFDRAIPEGINVGDAVESANWHASVVFSGNTVKNNRARGSLFTTPKPILIENNRFVDIAGSAILLAGDANGWYESGACADVLIRKNLFKNNLTSRFQFTSALISIFPTVPHLKKQTEYYHRNVRIEDNVFETFDVPLLFAISTENLKFTHNNITYNNSYPAWHKPPFILRRCSHVEISKNTVKNPPTAWTLDDAFKLDLTPKSEITFRP